MQTQPTTSQTHSTKRTAGQLLGRILNPPFMRRLNARLIRQHPWLWSMRLHHAAYFAALLNLVGLGMVTLAPLRHPSQLRGFVSTTVWLLIVLQVAAMFVWRYGQDRFHVVREAGRSYDKTGWREFFGYVFALILLMSSLPIFLGTLQLRVRNIDQGAYAADLLLLRTNYDYVREYVNSAKGEVIVERVVATLNADPLRTVAGNDYAHYLYYPYNYNVYQEAQFLRGSDSAAYTQLVQNLNASPDWLLQRLSHYSGTSMADVERATASSINDYLLDIDDYSEISYTAYANARDLFRLGLDTSQRFVLISWLVTFALALHFGLVRLLYKYNSKRAIILITAVFSGAFFVYWFGALFFGLLLFDWMGEISIAVPSLLFIGFTIFCYLRSVRIMSHERYSRWHALQLAALPILLIALPYVMLIFLGSLDEFRYLERHLFGRYTNTGLSIYPYGGWILYSLQFAYVPFIPMLKQRFVRLESLPRG